MDLLFLYSRNSVRSLIAEGLLRHFGGDVFNAFSAESNTTGLPEPICHCGFARSKKAGMILLVQTFHIWIWLKWFVIMRQLKHAPFWPRANWLQRIGGLIRPLWMCPKPAINVAFAATYDELVRRITHLLRNNPDATNIESLAQQMTS